MKDQSYLKSILISAYLLLLSISVSLISDRSNFSILQRSEVFFFSYFSFSTAMLAGGYELICVQGILQSLRWNTFWIRNHIFMDWWLHNTFETLNDFLVKIWLSVNNFCEKAMLAKTISSGFSEHCSFSYFQPITYSQWWE